MFCQHQGRLMIYGKARKQQIYTPHLSRSRQMLKMQTIMSLTAELRNFTIRQPAWNEG